MFYRRLQSCGILFFFGISNAKICITLKEILDILCVLCYTKMGEYK